MSRFVTQESQRSNLIRITGLKIERKRSKMRRGRTKIERSTRKEHVSDPVNQALSLRGKPESDG